MKTEEQIKKFLEILKEKQKHYNRGLDFSGEILALEWVLDKTENMGGLPL